MTSHKEEILKIYKDSYLGPDKIYEKLKHKGIKYDEIREALKDNPIYEAYKPYQKNTRSFISYKPFQQWQIDLMFINARGQDIPILVCVDVFSKYASAYTLPNKESNSVINAMNKIFIEMDGIPESIYCDEGSEFINKNFQQLMNEKKINILYTRTHAQFVESLIRTLKLRIYKILHDKGFKTFSNNLLQKVLFDYNNSFHRTIKMNPIDAHKNDKLIPIIKKNIISKSIIPKRTSKHEFKIGDSIRFIRNTSKFKRGYEPIYTLKTYEIENIENEYIFLKGRDKAVLKSNIKPATKVESDSNDENEYQKIKEVKKTKQFLNRNDINPKNIIESKRERKATERLKF